MNAIAVLVTLLLATAVVIWRERHFRASFRSHALHMHDAVRDAHDTTAQIVRLVRAIDDVAVLRRSVNLILERKLREIGAAPAVRSILQRRTDA